MLEAEAGRLLLELEIGDALTQRIKLPLQLQSPLVAGAQLGRQVVVFAALGPQGLFTLQFQRQRVLQAGLCGSIGQAGQFFAGPFFVHRDGLGLLGGGFNRPAQFTTARFQTAQGKGGFLGLAFELSLLIPAN